MLTARRGDCGIFVTTFAWPVTIVTIIVAALHRRLARRAEKRWQTTSLDDTRSLL